MRYQAALPPRRERYCAMYFVDGKKLGQGGKVKVAEEAYGCTPDYDPNRLPYKSWCAVEKAAGDPWLLLRAVPFLT